MFVLSRSSCSSRSPFFENRAPPFTLSYYCLPFEARERGPKPPLLLAPMGTGPSMPMWVCGFGGWCVLVWPGRKTRPARHAARVLPRCPAAAPPLRRLQRADTGGNASAPSSPRKVATDQDSCSAASAEQTLPRKPWLGPSEERPANWSTALSGTGTTGPTPRRGRISKISAPRSAPIVHLCQKLLPVDSETTMSVHDRRPPPARPLHHP